MVCEVKEHLVSETICGITTGIVYVQTKKLTLENRECLNRKFTLSKDKYGWWLSFFRLGDELTRIVLRFETNEEIKDFIETNISKKISVEWYENAIRAKEEEIQKYKNIIKSQI